MKLPSLPLLLSINAGYVDTAGFLALAGLFTAHVTGNFVTLGAVLVLGVSGLVSKLLALPVFALFVALTRVLGLWLAGQGRAVMPVLLWAMFGLLVAFGALALVFGPFGDPDTGIAVLTGMVGVAAMAIQNALQRLHLGTAPPTTLMTGNTTQVVIDVVDLVRGAAEPAALGRLGRMGWAVVGFAAGCLLAAVLIRAVGMGAFVVPPLFAAAALLAERGASAAQT
jgi:uncharacterized membrane protein YoaK (UPF0700 family)